MEIRSKKIEVKAKILVMWLLVAVVIVVTVINAWSTYYNYRAGQFIARDLIDREGFWEQLVDAGIVEWDSTYDERRDFIYEFLNTDYSVIIDKYIFEYSVASDIQEEIRNAVEGEFDQFADGVYPKYHDVSIWFKYATFFEYWSHEFALKPISIVTYIVFLLAIFITMQILLIRRRELVVSDSYVICKYSDNKIKQIFIQEIQSVQRAKRNLLILGNEFQFKIKLIENAAELEKVILEKKNELVQKENTNKPSQIDAIEEIKRYKEILDAGLISEEEFIAKKKQILNI